MSLLLLAGLGLDADLPKGSAGKIKKSRAIFLENYTNLISKKEIAALRKLFPAMKVLGREEVEGEGIILDALANGDAALLVSGDPLIATTHHSLVLSAKKKGHKVRILHSSSIISAAISESMLQAYKFGKLVTIPYPRKNFNPASPYENIKFNFENNLHTLLLLDLSPNPMSPQEAFGILLGWERELKKKVIAKSTRLIVLSSVGKENSRIIYGTIDELEKQAYDNPPHCLVLPAKLHFIEEELLSFYGI